MTPQSSTKSISEAVRQLANAKVIESEAQKARLQAESNLLKLVGDLKAEGSLPISCPDAGYRATITTSLSRKVDQAMLQVIAPQIPEAFAKRLIRWKAEVNVGELRFLQNNEPDLYRVVSQAIETKPAKPSIKLDLIPHTETMGEAA